MIEEIDPVILRAMADAPLGRKDLNAHSAEAKGVARRCAKIWLPEGKRSANSLESREAKRAFYANQTDLEDAVEAAGGSRGSISA